MRPLTLGRARSLPMYLIFCTQQIACGWWRNPTASPLFPSRVKSQPKGWGAGSGGGEVGSGRGQEDNCGGSIWTLRDLPAPSPWKLNARATRLLEEQQFKTATSRAAIANLNERAGARMVFKYSPRLQAVVDTTPCSRQWGNIEEHKDQVFPAPEGPPGTSPSGCVCTA